ncbi:hypothetical protein ACOMHN_048128 [Nucella lapillus]
MKKKKPRTFRIVLHLVYSHSQGGTSSLTLRVGSLSGRQGTELKLMPVLGPRAGNLKQHQELTEESSATMGSGGSPYTCRAGKSKIGF